MKRGEMPEVRGRRRVSAYSIQLREKQKLRMMYGILETQFHNYFTKAAKTRNTAASLVIFLEQRLDNVVFRLGFAESRPHARALVSHGHFSVNGRRTDVPSMIVRLGDSVAVREGSRTRPYFKDLAAAAETRTVPRWLERDLKGLAGKVLQNPERTDIDASLHEQLIVEFYSR
jgi:small subunit ribosomal protein S4